MHRKQITENLKKEGFITTDVRIQILKDKLNEPSIKSKERMEIIMFLMNFFNREQSKNWDVIQWFKDLVRLSEDSINEPRR